MKTENQIADVPLTHADLLRLKRWYQQYALNPAVTIEPADLILDDKLRNSRYDMLDRDDAAVFAMRERNSNKQYIGPERRARAPILSRIRVKRAVVKVALTH